MSEMLVQVRKLAALEAGAGRRTTQVVLAALFAALTALGAYAAVPLPGTAVPVTLQTMVVILAGALLGPRLGAASQALYLAVGAAGAPVFFGGAAGFAYLFGPTGGYLLAFPVAAAIVGTVAGPGARGVARRAIALALGSAVILAGGAAQLALLTGDAGQAVRLGVAPFLVGEGLKVVGALLLASRFGKGTLGPV